MFENIPLHPLFAPFGVEIHEFLKNDVTDPLAYTRSLVARLMTMSSELKCTSFDVSAYRSLGAIATDDNLSTWYDKETADEIFRITFEAHMEMGARLPPLETQPPSLRHIKEVLAEVESNLMIAQEFAQQMSQDQFFVNGIRGVSPDSPNDLLELVEEEMENVSGLFPALANSEGRIRLALVDSIILVLHDLEIVNDAQFDQYEKSH